MIRKKCLSGGVILLISVLFILFSVPPSRAAVIYTFALRRKGAGLRNGSSWSNACGEAEFKTALDNAEAGSEIEFWVAKGTYRPSFSADANLRGPGGILCSEVGDDALRRVRGRRPTSGSGTTGKTSPSLRRSRGDDSANPDGVTETAAGIVEKRTATPW